MKKQILNLLGLAKRAGRMVSGEDNVIIGLQKKNVKLVFVANDASVQTRDKFNKKCFFYKVRLIDSFSTDEISDAIGSNRRVIGITDDGFVKAIEEKLEVQ